MPGNFSQGFILCRMPLTWIAVKVRMARGRRSCRRRGEPRYCHSPIRQTVSAPSRPAPCDARSCTLHSRSGARRCRAAKSSALARSEGAVLVGETPAALPLRRLRAAPHRGGAAISCRPRGRRAVRRPCKRSGSYARSRHRSTTSSHRRRAAPVHRLGVLATWLGNAAQRAAGVACTVGEGDVAERQDSHQTLVVVQHRQPTHLEIGYGVRNCIEIIVLEAVFHFLAHDLADWGARTL